MSVFLKDEDMLKILMCLFFSAGLGFCILADKYPIFFILADMHLKENIYGMAAAICIATSFLIAVIGKVRNRSPF